MKHTDLSRIIENFIDVDIVVYDFYFFLIKF